MKISMLRRACKIPSLKFEQQLLSHFFFFLFVCLGRVTIHSCFIRLQNLHVFH